MGSSWPFAARHQGRRIAARTASSATRRPRVQRFKVVDKSLARAGPQALLAQGGRGLGPLLDLVGLFQDRADGFAQRRHLALRVGHPIAMADLFGKSARVGGNGPTPSRSEE